MPTLEEVLKYADERVELQIYRKASLLPLEQKEEIRQSARIRIWRIYDKIDPEKGWKAYVQQHARGAVLDYIRWGNGFEESEIEKDFETRAKKKSENDAKAAAIIEDDVEVGETPTDAPVDEIEPPTEQSPWRLKHRVTALRSTNAGNVESSSVLTDVESIVSVLGVREESADPYAEKINWDLVARMASQDQDIHILAKFLIGFTHEEISEMWGVSRERITQRIDELFWRLNAPEHRGSRWLAQTIYAFGLCDIFGRPRKDLGFGHEYDPIDLFSTDVEYLESIIPQLTMEFVYN